MASHRPSGENQGGPRGYAGAAFDEIPLAAGPRHPRCRSPAATARQATAVGRERHAAEGIPRCRSRGEGLARRIEGQLGAEDGRIARRGRTAAPSHRGAASPAAARVRPSGAKATDRTANFGVAQACPEAAAGHVPQVQARPAGDRQRLAVGREGQRRDPGRARLDASRLAPGRPRPRGSRSCRCRPRPGSCRRARTPAPGPMTDGRGAPAAPVGRQRPRARSASAARARPTARPGRPGSCRRARTPGAHAAALVRHRPGRHELAGPGVPELHVTRQEIHVLVGMPRRQQPAVGREGQAPRAVRLALQRQPLDATEPDPRPAGLVIRPGRGVRQAEPMIVRGRCLAERLRPADISMVPRFRRR